MSFHTASMIPMKLVLYCINGSERDNNDRDLAWPQLDQKSRLYNIIEFKHYNFKIL